MYKFPHKEFNSFRALKRPNHIPVSESFSAHLNIFLKEEVISRFYSINATLFLGPHNFLFNDNSRQIYFHNLINNTVIKIISKDILTPRFVTIQQVRNIY